MHITFGWGCDPAPWTGTATPATLGTVVAGPVGLTDILATRFALTRPGADRPQRIAAYRAALLRVVAELPAGAWPAESTAKDPWTVARELLTWRDELVAAGWAGADHDSTGAHSRASSGADDTPGRLDVLSRIEALLPQQPGWSPGPTDVLRELDRTVTALGDLGTAWPTGITGIDVDHVLTDLPPVWQRILTGLAGLGVTVTELPAPAPAGMLEIRTADTIWDAAPATARRLADLSAVGVPHTVLAGGSTELLDRELVRIGGVPLGVRTGGAAPLSDVLGIFLRAATVPHDISALIDLLNVRLPAGDGTPRPLLPFRLHTALVRALNDQPGVGGPEWVRAVATALAGTEDADRQQSIRDFDRLIRQEPLVDDGTGYPAAAVTDHLDWLHAQLKTAARGDVTTLVADQVRQVTDLIATVGQRLSARELHQIIAEVTGTGGLRADAVATPHRTVVTDPAALGTGDTPVLWWLPVDGTAVARDRMRPDEADWLRSAGVELPDREAVARLTLDSQLRALRRSRQVTVVRPRLVDGAEISEHPALTFLRADAGESGVDDRPAELTTKQRKVPETVTLTAPDPVYREFTPNPDLLPTTVSFSQWEKILIHPLEWLLGYRLGVRPGGLADVPTGNRMIGTWLHAAVEHLVDSRCAEAGEAEDAAPVTVRTTAGEVRQVLTELLPWYASELELPGRQRERNRVLDLAVQSITGLFDALARADIRILDVESEIAPETTRVTGSRGAGDEELALRGFRDMDIVLADGTPGVIDLKYTAKPEKYRDKITDGAALQLAVYAASVTGGGRARKLADIPVAYFSLRTDELYTASDGFRRSTGEILTVAPNKHAAETGSTDPGDLWDRAVHQLNHVLDELRAGRVTDLGNLLKNEMTPDAGTREALIQARTAGFLPETALFTNFPLITGVKGDFA